MGMDIHIRVERQVAERWLAVTWPYPEWGYEGPFDDRDYHVFSFLADIKNHSGIPPIAAARGLPDDIAPETAAAVAEWRDTGFAHSWLTAQQLLAFDYDALVEDRRRMVPAPPEEYAGNPTCAPGEGTLMPWREFLGPSFMRDLARLGGLARTAGTPVRIVFWFDG